MAFDEKVVKDKRNYFFENTSKQSTLGDKNQRKARFCIYGYRYVFTHILNNCNSVEI